MNDIKVHIAPWYNRADRADGGIRRVTEAMIRYLPKFGIVPVENPDQADIINNHGAMLIHRPGIPMVHTGHGLYWSRQPWGDDFQQVNQQVVESMRHAVAHTAPSEWVSRAIRRGGLWYPEVVYHGIDWEDFVPVDGEHNYVLWNKARADYVSNPYDMQFLAANMPGRQFFSTIGQAANNVRVLGAMPYDTMRSVVAQAGVYLATARETFGIGTLEALACGVPVAGWDWGGQSEIIIQGSTGYLAPPGDFKALAECVERCFVERERLSALAVADVRERWGWEQRIEQYADIFKRVYAEHYQRGDKPKTSVIITTHNLDRYLLDCIESVKAQTDRDWECIVIDDAQSPGTEALVKKIAKKDRRIRYCPTPNNFGLPGARNFGLTQANGKYIRHLDADDMLTPWAIEVEAKALDEDSGIQIAYGHLEVVREDGTHVEYSTGEAVRGGWPPDEFSWFQQMAHLNQLPSCVMARREVYERSGGYRERMKRAEDADFWCRVTSLGFRAKKVTQAITYLHRERNDSKGATEWKEQGQEPDWTAWYPWRLGAGTGETGRELVRRIGNHPHPALVPFGAQDAPRKDMRFWYVHDYVYPVVSVIVTCGPGHRHLLVDALDSIQAQTFPDWECIVVNDTGGEWPGDIPGAPWAKVINMPGNCGASKARNAGLPHARGKFVVWMDADDYWLPWFLEKMVAYGEQNDGVIFSDIIMETMVDKQPVYKFYRYEEFDCQKIALSMRYAGSSVLVPKKIADEIYLRQGGYDQNIPGMEDWDYQTAVHAAGFCAYHLPEALFVYRMWASTKREKDFEVVESIRQYMIKKWNAYRTGAKKMSCGCSSKKVVTTRPASTLTSSGNFSAQSIAASVPADGQAEMVAIEYVGPLAETFTVRSRVSPGLSYRFGNNEHHRKRSVLSQDAEFLLSMQGPTGNPFYVVSGSGATMETHDPSAFLGQPITV